MKNSIMFMALYSCLSILTSFGAEKFKLNDTIIFQAMQRLSNNYKGNLFSYVKKPIPKSNLKALLEFRHLDTKKQIFAPFSALSFKHFLLFSALNNGFHSVGEKMMCVALPYIVTIHELKYAHLHSDPLFLMSGYVDPIILLQGEKGVKADCDVDGNLCLKTYFSQYSFAVFNEGKIFEDLKVCIELEKEAQQEKKLEPIINRIWTCEERSLVGC